MEKRKFELPTAILVTFSEEDIITSSGGLGDLYPEEPGDHDEA